MRKDLSLASELPLPALAEFEKEITQDREKGLLRKLGKDSTEAAASLRGDFRKQK